MTQFNAAQIIASPYGKFARESARLSGNVPLPNSIPQKSRQLQDAHSYAQARARGQTMTPGSGPGGVSPIQAGLESAMNVVDDNEGLNEDQKGQMAEARKDPRMTIQQYEGLAKGMKNRPQQYQAAGQRGARGSISIAPGTDKNAVSDEEFAKGQARVKAGLAPGENMISDVSDGAEGAVPGYTVTTPGKDQPQNPASQFIDSFKGQVPDESLAQAQAGLNAGMNVEQVAQHLHQAAQQQNAAAHYKEVAQGQIANRLRSHLERAIPQHQKLIQAAQSQLEMSGDPNSPEGKAATEQLGTLQSELKEMQGEYADINKQQGAGTSQQEPTNGQQSAAQGQPPIMQTPEDAAKLPVGTEFIMPDGTHRVRH